MGLNEVWKDPVVIVPYKAEWPRHFASERTRLQSILQGINFRVEHIGSTAIPDLAAKPIIDMMLGVDERSQIEERIPAFEKLGYLYISEVTAIIPDVTFFYRRNTSQTKVYHLHTVEIDSDFWLDRLLFRDYLRTNPEIAEQYLQLKLKIRRTI